MPQPQFGWTPTPPRVIKLVEELQDKLHGEALDFKDRPNYGEMSAALPDVAIGFKSYVKLYNGAKAAYEDEAQITGDCTTHALRNAINESRCVEIDIKGESEEYKGQIATEPYYKLRGHSGQGMNPGSAIQIATKLGFFERRKYASVDLSKYSQASIAWANKATKSLPDDLIEEGSDNLMQYFSRITTLEELQTAKANGYGVIHGSRIGVGNTRDSLGRAKWSTTWNHCMAIGGYEISDDLYFLFLNSWGIWNKGGHPTFGKIPGGSFMLNASNITKSWKQGAETWAVGNSQGYKAQKLPDYGTGSFI